MRDARFRFLISIWMLFGALWAMPNSYAAEENPQTGRFPRFETGHVSVGSTWSVVSLRDTYQTPVVVCTPQYGAGDCPALAEVRAAGARSFEVRLVNPGGGTLAPRSVHYLVMEAGVYTAWDLNGPKVEARRVSVSGVGGEGCFLPFQYSQSFNAPVVLGQVMTEGTTDTVSGFWACGASASETPSASVCRVGSLAFGEGAATTQTLGVIVVEAFSGSLNGVSCGAGYSSPSIGGFGDTPPYSIPLFGFQNVPEGAVVSLGGLAHEKAWPVLYGASALSSHSLGVALDESPLSDPTRKHTAVERVGYFVFEKSLQAPPVLKALTLRDPHPDRNTSATLYTNETSVTVELRGVQGPIESAHLAENDQLTTNSRSYWRPPLGQYDGGTTLSYGLTEGDGPKTVWAALANDGGVSFPPTSGTITLDTARPTVQLSTTAGDTTRTRSIPVQVRFSEPVQGLTKEAFQVSGIPATLSPLSGSGDTYRLTLDVNPSSAMELRVQLPENVAWDLAGNPNFPSEPLKCTVLPPLVTREFMALEDAFVDRSQPSRNFGDDATLQAKDAETRAEKRTFIKFRVEGVRGLVHSAKLRVHMSAAPSANRVQAQLMAAVAAGTAQLAVERTLDNTWQESEITWQNQPAEIADPTSATQTSDGSTTESVLSSLMKDALPGGPSKGLKKAGPDKTDGSGESQPTGTGRVPTTPTRFFTDGWVEYDVTDLLEIDRVSGLVTFRLAPTEGVGLRGLLNRALQTLGEDSEGTMSSTESGLGPILVIESFASMSTSLPSEIWIDFAWAGLNREGSSYNPYNSLTEGLNAVTTERNTIRLVPGATRETVTINKDVWIRSASSDPNEETIIGLSTAPSRTAPTIISNPQGQTLYSGESVAFNVSATGSAPLVYTWYKNGAAISDGNGVSGASTSFLQIADVKVSQSGSYKCRVQNSEGYVDSTVAALTVTDQIPVITTQPTAQIKNPGESLTLTVAAYGSLPLTYEWNKNGWPLVNGSRISGIDTEALTIDPLEVGDEGTYSCIVRNSIGATESTRTLVTVNDPPRITSNPQSQYAQVASNVTFSVAATGTGTLSYQWRKNGTAISGATQSTLILSSVTAANDGGYSCKVQNSLGHADSTTATLQVANLIIQEQPASALTLDYHSMATFHVSVYSYGAPVTYQWKKGSADLSDDSRISGATGNTLTISSLTGADAAVYTCVITCGTSNVTTADSTLTVRDPLILQQPQGVMTDLGSTVTLYVGAVGSDPLTYQWMKNGFTITGATSSTYSIVSVTPADCAAYKCVVQNGYGVTTTTEVSVVETNSVPLSLKASGGTDRIQLTWSDNHPSQGFTKFIVYRATSETGSFTAISGSSLTANTYTDTQSLQANTRYYYKVSAAYNNSTQETPPSNLASATLHTACEQPEPDGWFQ